MLQTTRRPLSGKHKFQEEVACTDCKPGTSGVTALGTALPSWGFESPGSGNLPWKAAEDPAGEAPPGPWCQLHSLTRVGGGSSDRSQSGV